MADRLSLALLGVASLAATSCESGLPQPDPDALRQPTGVRVLPGGRWLAVTNGNWDQREAGATLMAVDLDAVHDALARPAADQGEEPTRAQPCRRTVEGPPVECEEAFFIDEDDTVVVPSAAGNVAVDMPSGPDGQARLLIPSRSPPSVTWVDVEPGSGSLLDCGQDDSRRCDQDHVVTSEASDPESELPDDPGRLVVDDQGFRLAYLPHLLGGSISLFTLDGERGPELTDEEEDFFREAPFDDFDEAGGFSVAQRPCDPEAGNAPDDSRECQRPFLYATHRFWPGVRTFTVAAGLDVIIPHGNAQVDALDADLVESRPFMAGLAFEDSRVGDRLLVVQTTPAALVRLDTSVIDGTAANKVLGSLSLCNNPNHVVVHEPEAGEHLAFVSCFGSGQVAVIGLGGFTMLANIEVGDGANEMAIDGARSVLYVANTRENTISIVSIDPTSVAFLTERARIGRVAG